MLSEPLLAAYPRTRTCFSPIVKEAHISTICFRFQVLESVLKALAPSVEPSQLVVSIAAGVTIEKIESFVSNSPVVRVMPNTPAFVSEMASGYALGSKATSTHRDLVHPFLEAIGVAYVENVLLLRFLFTKSPARLPLLEVRRISFSRKTALGHANVLPHWATYNDACRAFGLCYAI